MKKIILFNPHSKNLKYSRDYFCSKVLKANHIEHPIDLLILSVILYNSLNVEVLDATVAGLDHKESLKRIRHCLLMRLEC